MLEQQDTKSSRERAPMDRRSRAMRLRVAAGQMLVEGGDVDGNMNRAIAMVDEAARRGCRIVVLPECLDVGWTHPLACELAEPIPGPRSQQIAGAAAGAGIFVVAGLTEREGNRIYNTAVLIDGEGKLLLKHRKINVLDIAQDVYEVGDRLGVARTDVGRLGINICADNFPNSLDIGRAIGRMGAQLLLSPSAWAVDADHDNTTEPYGRLWLDAYGQLARQFKMPVVGVSNVGPIGGGPWAGRKCIGCSLVVDSEGRQVVMGPYDEEALIVTELQLSDDQPKGTNISGAL